MSKPRSSDGEASSQRTKLPRHRKSARFELRPDVHNKLEQLQRRDRNGKIEPKVATLERLILSAHEALSAA